MGLNLMLNNSTYFVWVPFFCSFFFLVLGGCRHAAMLRRKILGGRQPCELNRQQMRALFALADRIPWQYRQQTELEGARWHKRSKDLMRCNKNLELQICSNL